MFPFVHVIFSFLLMLDITLFIYIMYTVLSWGGVVGYVGPATPATHACTQAGHCPGVCLGPQ